MPIVQKLHRRTFQEFIEHYYCQYSNIGNKKPLGKLFMDRFFPHLHDDDLNDEDETIVLELIDERYVQIDS